MAFTAQSTTGLADMISKLNTFLSGEGWSTHHVPASGEFAAYKNPSGSTWITLATKWDTATPVNLGIYQWHGAAYSGAANPWAQTNDSGNGAASGTNATLATQRSVSAASGADVVNFFWCFEDTNYFHVVMRTHVAGTERYQHFGAGLLTKYNDWTGGEYGYGHRQDTVNTNAPPPAGSTILLDGLIADTGALTNAEEYAATLHIEGMANQSGSGKWGVVMGNQASVNLGNDRAAVARIHILGGFRGGVFAGNLGNFIGTYGRGLIPMYPVVPFYWNRTTGNVHGPLGYMPDCRGVSLANFAAEDTITVGSDTWQVFPSHRYLSSGGTAGFTGFQGIAYKQVS